ncbi:hypothetical protein [Desulfovibrio porci]|uniref:hypothetical protein n=1 Tax=Desulfovibrio porci TaxID=2605782 RepID=UPI002A8370C8|nr:hypothetical protein [Desulfovibrio porci]MDY3810438.1 hypothetical protein [Desulfovibrio porci]
MERPLLREMVNSFVLLLELGERRKDEGARILNRRAEPFSGSIHLLQSRLLPYGGVTKRKLTLRHFNTASPDFHFAPCRQKNSAFRGRHFNVG